MTSHQGLAARFERGDLDRGPGKGLQDTISLAEARAGKWLPGSQAATAGAGAVLRRPLLGKVSQGSVGKGCSSEELVLA